MSATSTVEKYSTHRKVNEVLRYPGAFSSTTTPTAEQVENLIDQKMDYIDDRILDSFHLSKYREFRDVGNPYRLNTGRKVFLKRRNLITPLAASEGDSLLVYEGTTQVEYVGSKTEARANDFWLEDLSGVLHLNTFSFPQYRQIDFTYRYNSGGRSTLSGAFVQGSLVLNVVSNRKNFPMQGWLRVDDEEMRYNSLSGSTAFSITERGAFNTTAADHSGGVVAFWCPKDIEEACTKLVAIDLLNAEDWSSGATTTGNMPSGQAPIESKIKRYQEDIERILEKYIPIVSAGP